MRAREGIRVRSPCPWGDWAGAMRSHPRLEARILALARDGGIRSQQQHQAAG